MDCSVAVVVAGEDVVLTSGTVTGEVVKSGWVCGATVAVVVSGTVVVSGAVVAICAVVVSEAVVVSGAVVVTGSVWLVLL